MERQQAARCAKAIDAEDLSVELMRIDAGRQQEVHVAGGANAAGENAAGDESMLEVGLSQTREVENLRTGYGKTFGISAPEWGSGRYSGPNMHVTHSTSFLRSLLSASNHEKQYSHQIMDQDQALRSVRSASGNDDAATDFSLLASIKKLGMLYGLHLSDLFEAASIRHCLIADVLTEALGSDNMVGDTFVAVCDEQLAAAGALVSATGRYVDAEPMYYDDSTTDDHFPGFVFAGELLNVKTNPCRILVVPASYWHLDLTTDNYARNTVLLAEPRCRFPNKLYYLDALINMIATRTSKPKESNSSINLYLSCQLHNFLACVPKSLLARLPPEDHLFLDLFDKVMLPSARVKLCVEYGKIRRGETTVEEARTRIPRKDLGFAKFKADFQARAKAADAARRENQKENQRLEW